MSSTEDPMAGKLIITAAVSGSRATKEMNPAVPYSEEEIIQASVEAYEAGAAIAHIHVRDPKTGKPDQKTERFKKVLDGVRSRCDMIVNLSTSGLALDGAESFTRNLEAVYLRPDMCSYEANAMSLKDVAYVTSPRASEDAAKIYREYGVKPEIEVFDVGHFSLAKAIIKKGLIENPPYFQICMGVGWGIEATPENLLFMKSNLPDDAVWSLLAIGRNQFPMTTLAIILGGNVRVGFEDNIYVRKGVLAKNNAELVEMIVDMAKRLGRPIATAAEARQMLGIKGR